jgi:hypothetical protein
MLNQGMPMVIFLDLRRALWASAALACLPAVAQPAAPVLQSGPTRMQRCQAEIAGVDAKERTLKLRACLIGRAEGERLIARDCSRQFRSLPAGSAVDKAVFQKQCVAAGLQVSHDKLPRRKPPAPKPEAATSADKPAAEPSSTASPAPSTQP